MPALTEALGQNAGNLPALGVKIGGAVAGLAAGFSLHESIDTDEQAIILSRGRVRLDRSKTKERLGTWRLRKARKMITKLAAEEEIPARKCLAEYAKIYDEGGKFKFFSLRSIRKIKTNDQNSGLPKQRLVLGDDETWEIDSTITWAIESTGQNAARALLNASSQEEVTQRVIAKTAKAALSGIVSLVEESPRKSIFTSNMVFEKIIDQCGEPLKHDYGVTLLDYELISFGPTEAQTGVNGWSKIIQDRLPGVTAAGNAFLQQNHLHALDTE